jgi:hypothetical protein
MFHPVDRPMERGWVGRLEGDRVVHLAAQTLQHFFTGGSRAREHDEYARADVSLLAPVPHPPSVRVFEGADAFAFANPAAIAGPGAVVAIPAPAVDAHPRLAAVVADGRVAGFTLALELRVPRGAPPKDRDFGMVTGPVVVTRDDLPDPAGGLVVGVDGGEWWSGTCPAFDWDAACAFAQSGTTLQTGDLLLGPPAGVVPGVPAGARVAVAAEDLGELVATLA